MIIRKRQRIVRCHFSDVVTQNCDFDHVVIQMLIRIMVLLF